MFNTKGGELCDRRYPAQNEREALGGLLALRRFGVAKFTKELYKTTERGKRSYDCVSNHCKGKRLTYWHQLDEKRW